MGIKMSKLKQLLLISSTMFAISSSMAADNQLYVGETIYLNDSKITDVIIGNNSIVKAKKNRKQRACSYWCK